MLHEIALGLQKFAACFPLMSEQNTFAIEVVFGIAKQQ
jgi:hypothetical protein